MSMQIDAELKKGADCYPFCLGGGTGRGGWGAGGPSGPPKMWTCIKKSMPPKYTLILSRIHTLKPTPTVSLRLPTNRSDISYNLVLSTHNTLTSFEFHALNHTPTVSLRLPTNRVLHGGLSPRLETGIKPRPPPMNEPPPNLREVSARTRNTEETGEQVEIKITTIRYS
jgi:hypothetical protein